MHKIGILTFHYSNNYGGILQAVSLQKTIESLGYNVEVINYVPSYFSNNYVLSKSELKNALIGSENIGFLLLQLIRKVNLRRKFSKRITNKFNEFRLREMRLSRLVNEISIKTILNDYNVIIVGSDQVWNPSQRLSPEYFLNYEDEYLGRKVSYAADSTIKDVKNEDFRVLQQALSQFQYISVRNDHSYDFVKSIIFKDVEIVADPTLLYDFNILIDNRNNIEEYILVYVLGREIDGSHYVALEKIKSKYGNILIYAIIIPTINFEHVNFADKVFYDLDPDEWMKMFKNAKFIYTDSYHGVLFSLKLHKPFLSYYTEELRATRFIDLGKRYGISKYIVQNTSQIDINKSLEIFPDFKNIDDKIESQKKASIEFLKKALSE